MIDMSRFITLQVKYQNNYYFGKLLSPSAVEYHLVKNEKKK